MEGAHGIRATVVVTELYFEHIRRQFLNNRSYLSALQTMFRNILDQRNNIE
jgi:hypothetical protein